MKNGDFPVRYVTNYQRVPGITWISFRHRNFLCNSYSSMFWKILAKFKVSAVHADSSVDLRAVFLAQSLGARHTVAPHHRRLRMNLLPTKKSWLWSQNCRSSSFFSELFLKALLFANAQHAAQKFSRLHQPRFFAALFWLRWDAGVLRYWKKTIVSRNTEKMHGFRKNTPWFL